MSLRAGFWLLLLLIGGAPSVSAAACAVTPGSQDLLIRAAILTGEAVAPRAEVLIDTDGLIACVGPDCLARQPAATIIDCPDAVLSPGFINTHEHLAFSHAPPTPDDGERFEHRHDWRKGLRGHRAREGFTISRDTANLAWGELRHLLSGTTSIVGGDMAPGLIRNLDFHRGLEGLNTPRVTYAVFPLDDAGGALRIGDCDYGPLAAGTEAVAALHAYIAHVGEGVDAPARNEFACVSNPAFDVTPAPAGGGLAQDLVQANMAIVHGVALDARDLQKVAARRAAIIWSPRSNLSLYGATLDVATAQALGVVVALSTDWLPSGSISMPREAACAMDYAAAVGLALPARTLWTMMTLNGAKAAHMDTLIGAIRPGLAADLILVAREEGADPYEAVVTAAPRDLRLVMRGGRVLSGDTDLVTRAGGGRPDCEPLEIAGAAKTICVASEIGRPYRELADLMTQRGLWPAVFDGAPPVEPPCRPKGSGRALTAP